MTNPELAVLADLDVILKTPADVRESAERILRHHRAYLEDGEPSPYAISADLTGEDLAESAWCRIWERGTVRTASEDAMAALGVPQRHRAKTLENFDELAKLSRRVGVDLSEWPFRRANGVWRLERVKTMVLAYGPTGTGKTHLATAILRRTWEAGADVSWVSVSSFMERLKAGIDKSRERPGGADTFNRVLEDAKGTFLLVLDELVVGSLSTWESEQLSRILRSRYEEARPTIVTTNNNPEALHLADSRVASRFLGEESILVPLGGDDRRRPVKTRDDVVRRLRLTRSPKP